MIVSLGEIDSTALLAARGAGYSWGLAEEAGKSARWLAARQIPWLPTFLAMLASAPRESEFVAGGEVIRPTGLQHVSPLSVGAYIADARSLPVTLHNVRYPIWLLPHVATLVCEKRSPIAVSWEGAVMALTEHAVSAPGGTASLWVELASQVRIDWLSRAEPPLFVRQRGGVQVDPSAWNALQKFAARTYVPATDASRLRGAGAGISDAD